MSIGYAPDDDDDRSRPTLDKDAVSIDRVAHDLLPCGHDPGAWRPTTGGHRNTPPTQKDGVITILAGECCVCGTPIREFYSGEFGGPFLGREEFDPDDDVERRPEARVLDPQDDTDQED